MNDKLPPEVRMKVAEECSPDEPWEIFGNYVRSPFASYWAPDSHAWQWKALVSTAARLIEERFESLMVRSEYSNRLRHALSTDSVDDLERIVAELRGFV